MANSKHIPGTRLPIGVLIMAYGGPNSLDELPGYLADIRSGRVTTPEVLEEITHNYSLIGGKSPLLAMSQQQVSAVAAQLDPANFRLYLGMRHWSPWIEEVVCQMLEDGITQAVSLVLAPHFSKLSVEKYQGKIDDGLAMHHGMIEFEHIASYHDAPALIQALANRVVSGFAEWPADERDQVHVVFSAHSLPTRILKMGDPYDAQLRETAQLVATKAGLSAEQWSWSYQSAGRSPEPWLGPQIQEHLRVLAGEGIKNIISIPVGFVSDHVEILYDIDIQAQAVAHELGMRLVRPPALNDDPLFIATLTDHNSNACGQMAERSPKYKSGGEGSMSSTPPTIRELNIPTSQALFAQARELLPGGVNSPVRAFKAVGGQPLFIERGEGAYLFDVDGNRYVDYIMSWGPLILGHAHPDVVAVLQAALPRGTSYGAPCPQEVELAQLIQSQMPNMEMMRFVNSGTEATMSALRLARAYTGRSKIIKFEGNYHGHADMLLVQAGSGVATLGLPDSPGVPAATVADTLTARFNDLDSVARLFEEFPNEIAAIILEPVVGNMGLVPPLPDFLPGLRELTSNDGALLVFDEVMTGFRVHPGGAQTLFDIKPDLTALGKVIGGGLPVGAYGGRREIMEMVAPIGPMYQAGTLSGNPLAMTAGIATIHGLNAPGAWQRMEAMGERLVLGLHAIAEENKIAISYSRVGTMWGFFFTEGPVVDWPSAKKSDTQRFARYFQSMLSQGIYVAPSQFEAGFLSTAHGDVEIDLTLNAAAHAFAILKV